MNHQPQNTRRYFHIIFVAACLIAAACAAQPGPTSNEPLKPGEIVHIHFSKAVGDQDDSSTNFVRIVGTDGVISIQSVTIAVAGLTPAEASAKIQRAFEKHYSPLAAELRRVKPNASVYADHEAQTKFGIFLTINPNLDVRSGMVDIAHVQLASSPVISAEDLISYNVSDHSMKLKPDALVRIPSVPVPGLPFVVVANGQRIYQGAFFTEISSMSSEIPTIAVNKQIVAKDQPKDVLVIDRGYPTDSFGKGPDLRNDPRIKSALASLNKLQ